MRGLLSVLVSMLFVTTAHAAPLPGDSDNGKRLYDTHCTGCHDTSVHSRKDRAVRSFDALKEQVAGCSHMANAEFTADETRDLLKYLNDEFYRFSSGN